MDCKWLTLFELLSATIKDNTTSWGIAIVTKTIDTQPDLCGKEMTLEEKIQSAVSQNCATNTLAVNVVIVSDSCMRSADELPCNTGDMTFEQRLHRSIVKTTDGEYAFVLINITDPT